MTEILYTISRGGGFSILSPLLLLGGAWCLGKAALKRLNILHAGTFCAVVSGIDLTALLILLLYSLFPGNQSHVIFWSVFALLSGISLYYTGKPGRITLPDWKTWSLPGAFFLFLCAFFTANPQAWDECVYQLAVPLRWMRSGTLAVMHDLPYSGFPGLPQMLYVPLLHSGGTLAVKLFYGACQAGLLAGLLLLTKGVPAVGRILFVLSFMTAPIVLAGYRDIYAEVFLALNLAAGLYLLQKQIKKPGAYVLYGMFAGAMAAVKLTGFLPGICLLFAAFLRLPAEERKRYCFTAITAAALFALAFYLRPWIQTGNPCYPYLCRYITPEYGEMSRYHHALGTARFGYDNPVKGFIYSFRDLSLPGREKLFDGSYGITFLLFTLVFSLYLLLLLRKKKYHGAFMLYILPVLFYMVWYLTSPQARFLLPLILLTIPVFTHALRFFTNRQRKLFYLLLCAGLAVNGYASGKILRSCVLNWKQLLSGTRQSELDLLYGRTGDDYLPACEWLKAVAPQGKILLLFEERTLYLPTGAEIGTPLFQGKYFRDLNFTPESVLAELRKNEIKTVYLRLPVNNPDLLPEMLKQYQPIQAGFIKLAQQGHCRIKKISRDGLLISFSK
ncbi:MAG: hypothetical protein IKB16_06345 [Lentisphaeria bacterium]|nr:hypothetical protein [Lentisphaeria bacterium]